MKLFKIIAVTFMLTVASQGAFAAANVVDVRVNGLVCDFCARALEKVFSKEEAVQDIGVNLDTKIVHIELKEGQSLSDERIRELITDSGYAINEIVHGGVGEGSAGEDAGEAANE